MEKEVDLGLHTTHGVFVRDQLKDLDVQAMPAEKLKKKHCPVMNRVCSEKCALYDDGRCGIVTGSNIRADGLCPASGSNTRHCSKDCPVYMDGQCALYQERKENKNNE